MVRALCDIDDLSPAELSEVVEQAHTWKHEGHPSDLLAQQTLAMVFEKPSTRTRVSFETGMTQLVAILHAEPDRLDRFRGDVQPLDGADRCCECAGAHRLAASVPA